jgi:hypothetical protein
MEGDNLEIPRAWREKLDHNFVKISFNLDPTEWHLTPSEALWAEPLGKAGSYRVMNTPYFIRGISFLDAIAANFDNDSGFIEFSGVVLERSGHSTYRLAVTPDQGSFVRAWHGLEEVGCTYDSLRAIDTSMGLRDLFAVDVPPQTNIYEVYEMLRRGEQEGVWLFEEGHFGHKLRKPK